MKAGGELSGYREIQEKLKAPLGYPLPFFSGEPKRGKGDRGRKITGTERGKQEKKRKKGPGMMKAGDEIERYRKERKKNLRPVGLPL